MYNNRNPNPGKIFRFLKIRQIFSRSQEVFFKELIKSNFQLVQCRIQISDYLRSREWTKWRIRNLVVYKLEIAAGETEDCFVAT